LALRGVSHTRILSWNRNDLGWEVRGGKGFNCRAHRPRCRP
jgi:hypothetical protein